MGRIWSITLDHVYLPHMDIALLMKLQELDTGRKQDSYNNH